MDNCKRPSYEISIEEIRKNGGYYDINGLWNSIIITDDNKFLRERVETFIFKIDQNRELQVYLRLNNDNTYRIPGGSVTKGISDKKQAYLECKEEARIIVKDMEYTGIHYIREFENCNEIGCNEPDKLLNFIKWHGTYNKVYIGFFEAEYHGDIKKIDQDNDMYNNGKFYLIKDILLFISDSHKPIFDRVIEYSKSIQDYKDDYFQITLEEYNDSTNRQRIQAEYETNIRNLYLDNKFLFKIKFLEKQELLNLKSEIKDNQEAIPIANYQFYDSNGFTQLRDFLTSLNNSVNNKIEGYGFVIPDEHSMSGMIYVKPGLINEQQEIEQDPKNIQTVDNYSRTSRFSPTEIPTNSWVDDFYAEYKKYQQKEDKKEENKKALLDLGWDVNSGISLEEAMKMADIIENKALSDKVIEVDENFIFNEIEEFIYAYSDPDGEDILNENYIIDKKNAELDINMWKKDSDHNILFITGLSGSGKSTYARQLAKEENATIIELDIFQCYDKFKNAGTRKNDISMKMVSEFLEENPEMVDIDFSNIKLESFRDSFTKYFKWLLNKLHKSNERYIIEGMHIMLFIPYSDIKGEPIICIGTSMIKSFWRMWKREGLTHKDFIKYGKRYFLLYKEWERQYKNFQDSFNESYIEEASKSTKIKQSRLALTKNKSEVLTVEVLNKYKNQYRNLSHIKINQNTNGRIYTKNEKVVAMINTEKKSDGIIWIQGLEVFGDNQGQGFGYGLLDIAVNDLKATHLSVRKTNLKAKQLYENYGFTVYKTDDYMDYMKIQKSFKRSISESSLSVKKRNNLPDEVFGLPEKRKYPMPDKKHVLSAIKLFNFVDNEDEKELAENIKKKMKEYKIDNSHVGEKNRLKKYL